jgi:hypothetical protein
MQQSTISSQHHLNLLDQLNTLMKELSLEDNLTAGQNIRMKAVMHQFEAAKDAPSVDAIRAGLNGVENLIQGIPNAEPLLAQIEKIKNTSYK